VLKDPLGFSGAVENHLSHYHGTIENGTVTIIAAVTQVGTTSNLKTTATSAVLSASASRSTQRLK